MSFRADLHIHSSCSDGTATPLEILDLARAAGLSGLSITDHDTLHAYTPELFLQARARSLELLLGVEISSEWQGRTVHVLSYRADPHLSEFLCEVQERRKERNRRIFEKLRKKGILIGEEDFLAMGPAQVVGRAHIASRMVQKKAVVSEQEAYDRYLKDDACCYAPGGKFTPGEVIEAIHQERGVAILAHPHFFKQGRFLRDLLTFPFDGLECYYGRFVREQEAFWVQLAEKRNWLKTGGSDYHGAHRPTSTIGSSWVDEATFRRIVGG